jgi:hypothetical protein
MLSLVDAELSEEEELPSSAVVRGMAGGRRWGVLCCFMVGRARRRSDILVSFRLLRSLFCEKYLVWKVRVRVDNLEVEMCCWSNVRRHWRASLWSGLPRVGFEFRC